MVLRVDEPKLYSSAYRTRVLEELTVALMKNERVTARAAFGPGLAAS